MLTSEATLVYGLTVRSSALFFAADAWKRLKVQFPFFDLIFLRRGGARLISSGAIANGPVTQVPNEVWEEVRYWLVREEIADSEEKHLRPLLCSNAGCPDPHSPPGKISWKTMTGPIICEDAKYSFWDWVEENVSSWQDSQISAMRTLTRKFGLALPLDDPIRVNIENHSDPDALALIAAPSKLEQGGFKSPVVTSYGYDEYPSQQTLVQVSFELPSDIDSRFSRFIRLFNLEVIESHINKISSKGRGRRRNRGTSSSGFKNGVKNEVTKKIVPSWSLYVTGFET